MGGAQNKSAHALLRRGLKNTCLKSGWANHIELQAAPNCNQHAGKLGNAQVGKGRAKASLTCPPSEDVVVHLSDQEFEELVEAREQAWDRQIEAGKFDQLGRSAARLSRSEVHQAPVETRFGSQPEIFRHVSTSAPGIRGKARESYQLFVADPASVKFKAIKRLADGNRALLGSRRDCHVLGVLTL